MTKFDVVTYGQGYSRAETRGIDVPVNIFVRERHSGKRGTSGNTDRAFCKHLNSPRFQRIRQISNLPLPLIVQKLKVFQLHGSSLRPGSVPLDPAGG